MKTLFLFLILSSITLGQKIVFYDGATTPITPVYSADLNGTDESGSKSSPTGIDISTDGTLTVLVWFRTTDSGYKGFAGQRATYGWDFGIFNDGALAGYIKGLLGDTPTYIKYSGVNVTDGIFHLAGFTIKAARDSAIFWLDGVRHPVVLPALGDINNAGALTIGTNAAFGLMHDDLGQIQIIEGYEPTTAEILAAYNLGGALPSSYAGGTIVSWYKWAGSDDATFLSDTQGNNNLTGTNLTQADDQITYASGAYE